MPNRSRDVGLLLLRVGLGICFILHGWGKLTGGPAYWAGLGASMGHFGIHFAPQAWGFVGSCIEVFGGLLLALGLGTRIVAALLCAQMIVAITVHLHMPPGPLRTFATGWSHPLEDGIVFLALIFIGPGDLSLDRLIFDPRSRYRMGFTPVP